MKKIVTSVVAAVSMIAGVFADTPEEIAREEELTTTGEITNIGMTGRARITLDRADATYGSGTNAVFTVTLYESDNTTLMTSGTVRYSLDNFGATDIIAETTYDVANGNPFTVQGTLMYPGFLRLEVKGYNDEQKLVTFGQYSAAYEPAKITTARPKPADFDSFWDNAVANLDKEYPDFSDVELGETETLSTYTRQRISFKTVDNKRVYGAICRPKASGMFPLMVKCPGAGSGWSLPDCTGDDQCVYLYMSVHGFPLQDTAAETTAKYEEQEAAWAAIDAKSKSRNYPVGGLTLGRTKSHYYDKILGINRAINWAAEQDFVDPSCIVYYGASQGGGMGLILVGLNTHFTKAYTGVPAMCDWSSCLVNGRQSGWPRLAEYEPNTTAEDLARIETMQLNARYIDAAYFAQRITIPIRVTVGFIDESCAPHSVFAAYNGIPSKDKYLYQGVGGSHGSKMADTDAIRAWELTVGPKTLYVDCNAPAGGNGRSWAKAFQTIQEGVDAASTTVQDTVLVAPGVYDKGETQLMKNKTALNTKARVYIKGKSVKIKSQYGKEVTHIVGRRTDGNGGYDPVMPIMGVYVNIVEETAGPERGTIVEGFTIRDCETSSDMGSVGPAGVGSPLFNQAKLDRSYSNCLYVAYCTISNCVSQRYAAMRGGTAIGTLFVDNSAYSSTNTWNNQGFCFNYNCIITRCGSSTALGAAYNRSANGYMFDQVNCTIANNVGGRGSTGYTTPTNELYSSALYNVAIVDNGTGGDNYCCGAYSCVSDGHSNPAGVFYFNTKPTIAADIQDTVSLATLVNSTGSTQSQHQELFMAAPMGDFRPINGGYLYGKDGHYGKIEYTNLDFIPEEYKQRDFNGNKLADDAIIPIGVILPAATPATKPIKLTDEISVNGVTAKMSGEYIFSDNANTTYTIGSANELPPISMTLNGVSNEYLPKGETAYFRPGAKDGTTVASVAVVAADGVYYVDRTNGLDTAEGTQAAPFQSIQKAVDSIPSGKSYVVYVNEGVYDNNGCTALWPGKSLNFHARVGLTNLCGSAYIRATGKRENTIIEGAIDSSSDYGIGNNAMRIAANASTKKAKLTFSGFTFRKGRVDTATDDPRTQMGGGFLSYEENCLVVMDSTITDCAAGDYSCGYFTAFLRCLFKDNKAATSSNSQIYGRGVAVCCIFEDNPNKPTINQFQAGTQNGASAMVNCTIYTPNAASNTGVRGNKGPLINTIVISSAQMTALNAEYTGSDTNTICWGCSRVLAGAGVEVKNPKLKDPANGDYRPNENSPVWQAGLVPELTRKFLVADYNGDPLDISEDGTRITLGAVHTMGDPRLGLIMIFQ